MSECCENALVLSRAIILLASSCLLLAACGDSPGSAVTQPTDVSEDSPTTLAYAAPTTVGPEADEIMDGVREALVGLLMEREGLDRAGAEERADLLVEQSTGSDVVEQQLAIYANWMGRYPVHPVLGGTGPRNRPSAPS